MTAEESEFHPKQTVAEKIISEHLADGTMERGNEVDLRIDQTLTQDATGKLHPRDN